MILLAGFVLSSLGSFWVSRENVRKTITDSALPLTSDNIYSEIQRDLLKPVFISSVMATDTFVRDWILSGEQDSSRIINYLSEIKSEYQTITAFLVSDLSRNYYHATQVLKQVDESEKRDEWYFRVRSMETPFEINVDVDMANHDAMTVFVNYRVLDYDGKFLGATGVGLTLERVNQLIQSYESRYSRHILFTDADGTIVLDTQGRNSSTGNLSGIEGLRRHLPDLLQEESTRIRYKREGSHVFLNSRFVPELGWYLIVEQSEDILLAPLRKTLLMNLLIAAVTTVAVALLCIGSIRRYQRGLEERNARLSQAREKLQLQQSTLEQNARDLTEQNHKLESLNQERNEFLDIIAHDLRTPVHGIAGMCELLKNEGIDPADRRSCLDAITSSSESMMELIQNLSELRDVESMESTRNLEPMHWNQCISTVVQRFQRIALAKHIELCLVLDPNCDMTVDGKPTWMSIALGNLVSNAIKYSPPHSQIEVKSRLDQDRISVSVRDEGPGFSNEDLQNMYGKYQRLSAKPTGGETSTGLGLFIVQAMAARLKISIDVSHHPEGGAVFTLCKTCRENLV